MMSRPKRPTHVPITALTCCLIGLACTPTTSSEVAEQEVEAQPEAPSSADAGEVEPAADDSEVVEPEAEASEAVDGA